LQRRQDAIRKVVCVSDKNLTVGWEENSQPRLNDKDCSLWRLGAFARNFFTPMREIFTKKLYSLEYKNQVPAACICS
jgi:hypothetical protein